MVKIPFYDLIKAEGHFNNVLVTLPPHVQSLLSFEVYIGYRSSLLFWSNLDSLKLTDQQYSQLQSVYSPHLATLLRAWCIQHHPDVHEGA